MTNLPRGIIKNNKVVRAFDNYDNNVKDNIKKTFEAIEKAGVGKILLSGDEIFYTVQGEGVNTGQPAVFVRLKNCNLQCLHPDTEITMFDFSKKKLKNVIVGDTLLGVKKEKPNRNILVESKVRKIWTTKNKKVVKINDSLICSEDHPIYSLERRSYIEANKLKGKTGKSIFSVNFIEKNQEYIEGYLAGTGFADGSIYEDNTKFSFASVDKIYAERIREFFKVWCGKEVNIHEYRYSGGVNQVYDIRITDRDNIPRLVNFKFDSKGWFAGFFASWFDSDGGWSNEGNVQISRSRDFEVLQKISTFLFKYFSISSHINTKPSKITKSGILHMFVLEGSRFDKLQFLFSIDICLKRKLHLDKSVLLQDTPLVIEEDVYDGVLIDLETESGNLFANGLLVHNCTWCDSWYTWMKNTEQYWKEGRAMTFQQVADRMEELWVCENKNKKRVVFTGGEPLLQQDKLIEIIKLLPDWNIEFETNGTIIPDDFLLYNPKVQFNCSPKLAHSKNPRGARIQGRVLMVLNKINVNTTFKFVVMEPEDLDEIENDFVKPFSLDINKIAVMPQGVSPEEINMNMGRVVEACKKKGYRLFTRLHVQIWDGALRRV